MRWLKAIFFSLLFLIAVIFVVQNLDFLNQSAEIKLNLYFFNRSSVPLPFYVLLLLFFLFGVIFASFYTLKAWYRKLRLVKMKEKEIEKLKQELDSLRNLPIIQQK